LFTLATNHSVTLPHVVFVGQQKLLMCQIGHQNLPNKKLEQLFMSHGQILLGNSAGQQSCQISIGRHNK